MVSCPDLTDDTFSHVVNPLKRKQQYMISKHRNTVPDCDALEGGLIVGLRIPLRAAREPWQIGWLGPSGRLVLGGQVKGTDVLRSGIRNVQWTATGRWSVPCA